MRSKLARLVGCLVVASSATAVRADFSISNNLTAASGGTEAVTGSTYVAAGFASSTGGQLASVTLNVGNSITGIAELDIYSNNGLIPSSLVGTLTQIGSVTSNPSAVTWSASSITLTANTNYWVVLKAITGQFDWSWAADESGDGTGAGYLGTWAESANAGVTWFSYDSYPNEMNVVLASPSAVPEPSTLVLCGLGLGVFATWRGVARLKSGPLNS